MGLDSYIDDLNSLTRTTIAELALVGCMKTGNCFRDCGIERYYYFVGLSQVAQVEKTLYANLSGRESLPDEVCSTLLLQPGEDLLHAGLRCLRRKHGGTNIVLDHISDQHAEGREHSWSYRYQNFGNPQCLREFTSMEGASAAEGDEYEVARIVTSPNGDEANGGLHVGIDDLDDTQRSFLRACTSPSSLRHSITSMRSARGTKGGSF